MQMDGFSSGNLRRRLDVACTLKYVERDTKEVFVSQTHRVSVMSSAAEPATSCEHRLHVAVHQSICHCADCGEILPIFASDIAEAEDIIAEAYASGLVVTWPPAGRVEVADA